MVLSYLSSTGEIMARFPDVNIGDEEVFARIVDVVSHLPVRVLSQGRETVASVSCGFGRHDTLVDGDFR